MTRGTRILALLVGLAALAAAVAGCGGSDDDAGAVATAPASTTRAVADDPERERIVPGG